MHQIIGVPGVPGMPLAELATMAAIRGSLKDTHVFRKIVPNLLNRINCRCVI